MGDDDSRAKAVASIPGNVVIVRRPRNRYVQVLLTSGSKGFLGRVRNAHPHSPHGSSTALLPMPNRQPAVAALQPPGAPAGVVPCCIDNGVLVKHLPPAWTSSMAGLPWCEGPFSHPESAGTENKGFAKARAQTGVWARGTVPGRADASTLASLG